MRILVSTRRQTRKGVEAIFSTPRRAIDARFLIGVFVLGVGMILCVAVGLESQFLRLFGITEIGLYLSVLLSSLGLYLVVVGGAVSLRYSVFGSRLSDNVPLHHDSTISPATGKDLDLSARTLNRDRDVKDGLVATQSVAFGVIIVLESCVVLALFAGLADEYQSNIGMRFWIRSNFPLVQYFLNWPMALFIAAVLGLLFIQFLPGRRFAR